MTKTEIDALIARLRHQKPDGRLPSVDEDAAADAIELLSASKPAGLDQGYVTALIKRMQDYCDSLAPPIARGLMAEAVRALLAASPAAPSADAPALSGMLNAFRVTETEGDPDPSKQRFHMRFTFRSMEELHAADDQWRAFVNACASTSANVAPAAQSGEPVSNIRESAKDHMKRLTREFKRMSLLERGVWLDQIKREAIPFAAPQPSQPVEAGDAQTLYVECCECKECGHIGMNDSHATDAACGYSCGWSGPSPVEDKCPDCSRENVMGSACPKCSGLYTLIAEGNFPVAPSAVVLDDERAAFDGWCNSIPVNRSMGPWEIWQAARAASPQATVCATCNGHGMIGGPSYYAPDEGGEPCPDCSTATQPAQTNDARNAARWLWARANLLSASIQSGPYKQNITNVNPIGDANTATFWDTFADVALAAAQPASGQKEGK